MVAHCFSVLLVHAILPERRVKKVDVGIGYAVWAGIGSVGAALLGPVFFDEVLTPAKAFWLAVIIAGVIWLKLADSPTLRKRNSHG